MGERRDLSIAELLKIAAALAILLAGAGVFYHYVFYVPELDRKNAERAAQEKREATRRLEEEKNAAEKLAEQQRIEKAESSKREELSKYQARVDAAVQQNMRTDAYRACTKNARAAYEANWQTACNDVTYIQTTALLQNCLSRSRTQDDYRICYSNYGRYYAAPNCALPSQRAEPIERHYRDAQQRCIAEARLGL